MNRSYHTFWRSMCRLLLIALIAGLPLLPASRAWAQADGTKSVIEKTMPLGGSELMEYADGIKRLAISDPTIVDYVVLSKTQFMLVAKKAGEGDLYVWTTKETPQHFHVVVPPPSRMAEIVEKIKQELARPSISVKELNGVIVLEGEVANADEVKRADTIARALAPKVENLIRVVNMPISWEEPIPASPPEEKSLQLGKAETLDFRGITKMTVSDPSVLDCTELSKIQLLLVAKKVGVTNLCVWDNRGPHLYHVVVTPPPSKLPELAKLIKEEIGRPEISVSAHRDMLLLEGLVDSEEEVKRAEVIARAHVSEVTNLIRVRPTVVVPLVDLVEIQRVVGTGIRITRLADGVLLFEGVATPEQRTRLNQILVALGDRVTAIDMVTTTTSPARQILVRVKAVEINRSDLDQLGVEWGGITDGVATDQPIIFGEVADGLIPVDQLGPFRRQGLSARLQALITQNRARILAEPNLLVTEGQPAEILVGGEIPIPVAQTVGEGTGTVSVEWKEFGVRLAMKAIVSPDAQSINLDVAPEVSNLDFGNAIIVGGLRLPALQTRRVHSVLTIRDRQTLVIGGLYQVERSRTVRKIPLLGDIPLIGELFKRTDKQSRDTELVIFVTPEIVTDASSAARTLQEQQRMGVDDTMPAP